MKKKRTLLIVIIIIAVLTVLGSIFAYLFIKTDVFKSTQELFGKYMLQDIDIFQKLLKGQICDVYQRIENEESYDANSKITFDYSEGGEISNPLNDLSLQLDFQKNNNEQYVYTDLQVLFEGEEYLETELIRNEDLYGIRFSDVAKQFVTVKNDEKLEQVENDIGIENGYLSALISIINGEQKISDELMSQENVEQLKEKIFNIISETISKGSFSKLKDVMITYNKNTIKTNAYTVELTYSQVEDMIIQMLNYLKNDTKIFERNIEKEEFEEQIDVIIKDISENIEIPGIKITIYEQKQQTVRTVIEIETLKILIENVCEDNDITSKIQILDNSSDEISQLNIEINKEDGFDMFFEIEQGEKNYTISFLNNIENKDEEIILDSSIIYEKDILKIGGTLKTNIKIGEEFEKKEVLNSSNNVVLNNLQVERRKSIINQLKEKVPEKIMDRLKLLIEALDINPVIDDEIIDEENNMEVEINNFNAKFEFYTGKEVSAENVRKLLEIVKNHLENYEVSLNNDQENLNYNVKLIIKKDQINENAINDILNNISDDKKYNISIVYKTDNGLIDFITITEIV